MSAVSKMSFSATGRPCSGLPFSPSALRGLARAVEIERDERADLAFALGDGIGAELHRQRGRQFAAFEAAGEVER